MGHKGDIEATYTLNKHQLPDDLEDDMRRSFRESEQFLDIESRQEDPLVKERERIHKFVELATPEQMQKVASVLDICNT